MKIMVYDGPRKLRVEEAPSLPLKPDCIRTKSLFSGISHGTEMNIYRGVAPFFHRKADWETRLFVPAKEEDVWTYPVKSCEPGVWYMGYANVGEVIEVGSEVEGFEIGDIVYASAPHQSECMTIAKNAVKLPKSLNPEKGIFFTNLMTVLNGILDTRIKVGDTVVVSGLGVLGQMATQLAKKNGAFQVFGVDLFDTRNEIAKENGVTKTFKPGQTDIALEVRKLTNNRGADSVIEVSGNINALQEAIRIAAPDTTITAMGWYPTGNIVMDLSEEFHHNRVAIRSSQTGNLDPSIRHMWNDQRKTETVLELLSKLSLENLITHRIPFDNIPLAYEKIDHDPSDIIQYSVTY